MMSELVTHTEDVLSIWHDYMKGLSPDQHSVVGKLRVMHDVESQTLGNKRDILVYLPPSYHRVQRFYPVIYMHDGQNLFDNSTSFVGEWEVDETMESLASEGYEAIIVGIPNTGETRILEYNPFEHPRFGSGRGDDYLSFIVDTVKPLIDTHFRTLPEREHTGIMGSSMGGLISLYAFFARADVFGLAGVLSPSLWIARNAMSQYIRARPYQPGKLYLDVGGREIASRFDAMRLNSASRRYCASVRRLARLLEKQGYKDGELLFVEDREGTHSERDWARRLPDALRFLLAQFTTPLR